MYPVCTERPHNKRLERSAVERRVDLRTWCRRPLSRALGYAECECENCHGVNTIIVNSFAVLLTASAAYIIVMNYAYVILSHRNKRRGIDRYHSTVPFVAQILLILSDRVLSIVATPLLSRSWLLALGLADISLWLLVFGAITFVFRRR